MLLRKTCTVSENHLDKIFLNEMKYMRLVSAWKKWNIWMLPLNYYQIVNIYIRWECSVWEVQTDTHIIDFVSSLVFHSYYVSVVV